MITPDSDKMVKAIVKHMFDNNPSNFEKCLWRMASGVQSKAYEIVREFMARYSLHPSDNDIEWALAELTGGCEVEWLEPTWHVRVTVFSPKSKALEKLKKHRNCGGQVDYYRIFSNEATANNLADRVKAARCHASISIHGRKD